MARIFRHEYTTKGPDGSRTKRKTRKWYIEFQGPDGKRKRVAGFVDKASTLQRAAKLERAAERDQADLTDRFEPHRKRSLLEHIDDWRAALIAKGTTTKHADLLKARTIRLCNDAGFRYWTDLSADRTQRHLADMKEKDTSLQTVNFYLQAIKQLCRWMVADGRAPDNPLAHVAGYNVRTDRRHDRRALTDAELSTLIETVAKGPERYGLPGTERALMYRLAAETGLRAAEIRSLKPSSFKLDSNPPVVVVDAAYSKRRRQDELPLRSGLVPAIRAHLSLKTPDARVFGFKSSDKTARMIRADLKAAGIAYRDAEGRVADFHALRHTFITNLARSGVHPKIAQQLARHSTITLTMNRYSHTVLSDLSLAVESLPEIQSRAACVATGTNGAASRSEILGVSLGVESAKLGIGSRETTNRQATAKGSQIVDSSPETRKIGEGGIRTPGTGLTPYDGLANRCFQPLSHLSTRCGRPLGDRQVASR